MSGAAGHEGERRLLRWIATHRAAPGFVRRLASRIEGSSLGYRLAHGAFWTLLGIVLSRVLQLAGWVVTARVLGRESFGEVGIIIQTILLFQAFASFGLGVTATKYVAELRAKDPARAGSVLALSSVVSAGTGLLAAVALVVYAPWLAARTLEAPHLAYPLRVGAVALLFNTLNAAQVGALSGFEAFRTGTRLNALSGAAGVAVTVAAVLAFGLEGVIWGMAGTSVLQWALTHFAVRRHARAYGIRIGLAGWRRELPVLWRFSLPAVAAGVMVGPVGWATNAILVQAQGYAEMGVLNAANQWFSAVQFLPAALNGAVLPVLSERIGQGDGAGARRVLRGMLLMNAAVVAPIVLAGSLGSPWIMALYGPGFRGAWPSLVVVLVTAGIVAATNPVGAVLAASGRLWIGFWMNAGWAIVWLAGTALLVRWGALGVVGARLVAYGVHAVWTIWFALRYLRAPAAAPPARAVPNVE